MADIENFYANMALDSDDSENEGVAATVTK